MQPSKNPSDALQNRLLCTAASDGRAAQLPVAGGRPRKCELHVLDAEAPLSTQSGRPRTLSMRAATRSAARTAHDQSTTQSMPTPLDNLSPLHAHICVGQASGPHDNTVQLQALQHRYRPCALYAAM
jgi:hypothetical protein